MTVDHPGKFIRVVLADDQGLFRQGLTLLLKAQPDVAEVLAVETLADLASILPTFRPDVLLLDLVLERSALADIPTLAAATRVIVVTASDDTDQMLEAVRAGASGVVFKRAEVETLMAAVRSVLDGFVWLPPAVQARLTVDTRGDVEGRLTEREVQVVRLVALGSRNAEVAEQLFISEQTVKTHLTSILKKLAIRGRSELVLYAARAGLIGINDHRL
jgi:two-component system NarL family response regulator